MPGEEPPEVAVVITTCDHAPVLERAITSARGQTHPPAEVIVVDDGSVDHPELVVARFPDVRLVRQPNRGLAAARNTGWRAAASPFVTFLDADDRLLPHAIEVNVRRLITCPEAPFAYGAYSYVDPDGRRRPEPLRPADGFAALLRENVVGMHGTVLYRAAALAAAGGFAEDLRACEDYDMYLRLARISPPMHGVEVVAEYHLHGANMSGDAALMLGEVLRVLERHRGEAVAAGCADDLAQGIAAWKRFYATSWWHAAGRALAERRATPQLVRQGAGVAVRAPGAWVGVPTRALAQRARRLAGHARRRSWAR